MTTGIEVVQTARKWIDTPFKHQARVLGLGVDCGGVLLCVAHERGLSDYDIDGYPRVPDGVTIKAILRSQMIELDNIDCARVGDALLFAFEQDPQHLGIITRIDPMYLIHAYQPRGKVIEHRIDNKWRRRVRGVYRFPGVVI